MSDPNPKAFRKYGYQPVTDRDPPTAAPPKPPAPNSSQRDAALDLANQVRVDRAKLRARIGAGEVCASDVLADMPDCIKGCGVYTFLTYINAVGSRPRRTETAESTSKAFVLLRRANCIQVGHKRLDQLTTAQLERLTRVVAEYENRHPAERNLT